MPYQGGGYGPGAAGGGMQRPYAGPAAQRPAAPGGYGDGYPRQQYNDDYNDGYAYDNHVGAYGDNNRQPRYEGDYSPSPGPGRGRGAGPMNQYPRSGPVARPGTADNHRGGPLPPRSAAAASGPGRGSPPRGRGSSPRGRGVERPGQYGHPRNYDDRQPPPSHPNMGYGGYDQDQQLAGQMSGMAISRQRSGGAANYDSRGQDEYGRPMNGGPRERAGYRDPRQGPPAGQADMANSAAYDGGYVAGPQYPMPNEFVSPPSRSMTMPTANDSGAQYGRPPPRRVGTAPMNAVGGPDSVPPRPSTAGGHRPSPQRTYSSGKQTQAQQQYDGGYNGGEYWDPPAPQGPGSAPGPPADGAFGPYHESRPNGNDYQQNGHAGQPGRPGFANFEAAPANRERHSYEHPVRPAREPPQHGAHGRPMLHHAKSEANLHQPQAAVFEMVGDIPSMPPVSQMDSFQPEYNQGYGGAPSSHGYAIPRGPSAASAPGRFAAPAGPGGHPAASPSNTNVDGLPSHPTPVRPGLMPGSVVSLNRPPPVRNYGGVAPPQHVQYGQAMSPQQGQQHPPQQQEMPPARSGYQAPENWQLEEPVTSQELESLRMAIKMNPNDQDSALRLAKRLIEAADVLAPKVPDPRQRAKARERYLMDSHKILKKLSNGQSQEAMFILADGLGKGLFGHEPDNKEAFTLYQSAAKLGHAPAAYRTAVCCEIGHEEGGGTRKDPLKAMQWYKRAATLGDPPAMYKVGMILLKGLLGQPKNPREAVGWLKRAAERADAENPHALHELGLLYESAEPNDAIIRDWSYALSLFQQAADLGYKFSQFKLGMAFEQGLLGVAQDHRQSIYWYSQAAQQEEHQSELALSGWYLTGSPGVLNQSDTEAYLWARKAAVAGLAKAEYAMGYFTETGIGIPPNLEDAKRWYWRAAAQNFPKARDRLEELKRVGKSGPARPRERISRSRIEKQDGDCGLM